MHHRLRSRQFIATATLAALLTGSWAPGALAQTHQPGSAPAPQEQEKAQDSAPAAEAQQEAASSAASNDEERRAQARAAFEAAQKAFEEGDYATAYAQFRAAHDLIPSPHAEYWMAASLDHQGREQEAARAYQAFLSHPGASHVGEDKVAEARSRFAELKGKLPARVTVTTDPAGAQVTIDGAVQPGTTPLTVELAPGAHRVEASLSGYLPAASDLQVQGGDELEQRIALEPEPAAAPVEQAPAEPVSTEPAERSLLPAYITLGLAGAGLVTGTIFGIKALADKSDFNDNPTASRADAVERNALIADMAFGVAITLGITGIVLLTSSDSDTEQTARAKQKRAEPSFAFAPVVGPQLGGAAARVTF